MPHHDSINTDQPGHLGSPSVVSHGKYSPPPPSPPPPSPSPLPPPSPPPSPPPLLIFFIQEDQPQEMTSESGSESELSKLDTVELYHSSVPSSSSPPSLPPPPAPLSDSISIAAWW